VPSFQCYGKDGALKVKKICARLGILFASVGVTQFACAKIREIDLTFPIATAAERIDIDVPIESDDGSRAFLLTCLGGTEAHMAELSSALKDYYTGPMVCLLRNANAGKDENLLAEDDVASWHTRGQFRWNELTGKCGGYPEFGRVRDFRLQGMRLTLEATDLQISGGELLRFNLRIKAKNDPGAMTGSADRPGYLPSRPALPGGCDTVNPGSEPRMCRDENVLWRHCEELGR
jgi:hypothetical protein